MRHVLSEERAARLDARVAFAVATVAEAARCTEVVEKLLVDLESRQVEHAPVAVALADRRTYPLRREAVVAWDV